jgi:hypothetical protein
VTDNQKQKHTNEIMNVNDETDCWNGNDGYPGFGIGINDFDHTGRQKIRHGVLPVHVDHPTGGSNSAVKAAPEGSCEDDGQDHLDD